MVHIKISFQNIHKHYHRANHVHFNDSFDNKCIFIFAFETKFLCRKQVQALCRKQVQALFYCTFISEIKCMSCASQMRPAKEINNCILRNTILDSSVLLEQKRKQNTTPFLAHLSRRLTGELIVYQSSRRPSVRGCVRPSVRSHFQT